MLTKPNTWITRMGVCLCLLAGQTSLGNPTLAVESQTENPKFTLEDVFACYDVNEDGSLDKGECACLGSKRCDVNKDGKVSPEEFAAGVKKLLGSEEIALKMVSDLGGLTRFRSLAKSGKLATLMDVSMDKVFAQWDRNRSGVLEPDECVCQGSKSADFNKDGRVTKEEITYLAEQHYGSVDKFLTTVRQHGGVVAFYNEIATDACSIGAVFARFDTNKNGSIESCEWECDNSGMADRNKDGYITEKEMVAMAKRAFGSVARFEQYVKSQGGAAKFHARRHR